MNKVIAIAAMGRNRELGTNGTLPWPTGKYRDDMQNFLRTTMGEDKVGHPCIMTSATWNSIDSQWRPLKGRPNIVVTSQLPAQFQLPKEVIRARTPQEAVEIASELSGADEIYICGGRYLYKWAIDNADELLLTEIPEEFPDADAFFPEFLSKGWVEVERTNSPNNQCVFVRYRKSS